MNDLFCKIIIPNKVLFEGYILSITVQGIEGSYSILKGHAPFISLNDENCLVKVRLEDSDDSKLSFFLQGGITSIIDNEVLCLGYGCEKE